MMIHILSITNFFSYIFLLPHRSYRTISIVRLLLEISCGEGINGNKKSFILISFCILNAVDSLKA